MTGNEIPQPSASTDPVAHALSVAGGTPDLAEIADLGALDLFLARASVPVQDATVVGLVAEILGRDG